MIDVYCQKVEKKERGEMRVFRYKYGDRRKNTRRKIPKNAVYRTHNGHSPQAARGCDFDRKDNYVYWDKDLNPLLNIRIEDDTTWWHVCDVPKGVITQHKNALIKWLEESK